MSSEMTLPGKSPKGFSMKPSDFDVDARFVSLEEVDEYLIGLTGRERRNYRRIQAWINHCTRIRSHPSSMIPIPGIPIPGISIPGESSQPRMIPAGDAAEGLTLPTGSLPGSTACGGVVTRLG